MEGARTATPSLLPVRAAERDAVAPAVSEAALRRLAEAARKPIAIIAAPAGTGKSTLLRAFAARENAVLIDAAAGKPTFRDAVRLLCEALQDIAPGARLAFASAFRRAEERGQRTTAMARWLASYLHGTPTTIVVDTVDRLGVETPDFAEFAEALVRCAPGVRLVVAARDHADLPIPRWFAADLTSMPLGVDDLGLAPVRALPPAASAPTCNPVASRPIGVVIDELVSTGRIREAIELASAAASSDRLMPLLRDHGLALEDRGDVDAVDAALDALDESPRDSIVLLLRASREARLGRTDTAEAWYRHAIDAADSQSVAADAAYRLGRELVRRERADAVELLEPYASDTALDVPRRCSTASLLAEAYLVAGRPADALETLHATLCHADSLLVPERAQLLTRASYIEFYAGDRAKAREYATLGAVLADEAQLYVLAVGAYSVLYNIAYEDAGPAETLAILERLAESAIRSGNVDFHLYTLVAAYELYVEQGDATAVERVERDLREFDLHYGAASAVQGLLPSRAVVKAWSGAFGAAYELLAATASQQVDDPDREALRCAEIALYAAAAQMPASANDALRAFEAAYARDGGATQYGARGAILAGLAESLLGRVPVVRERAISTPRVAMIAGAARVALAWRERRATASEFLGALADLRRHDLGGFAKLLAALPERAA